MMGQGLGDMLSGGSNSGVGGGIGNIQSMLSGLNGNNEAGMMRSTKSRSTRSRTSQAVYSTGSRCTK